MSFSRQIYGDAQNRMRILLRSTPGSFSDVVVDGRLKDMIGVLIKHARSKEQNDQKQKKSRLPEEEERRRDLTAKRHHPSHKPKPPSPPHLSYSLRKKLLEFLIQPFHILTTLPRPPSPMTPNTRENLQSTHSLLHTFDLKLRVLRRKVKVSFTRQHQSFCFDTTHSQREVVIVRGLSRAVS
jgi:hypothetical protein